jgi:hypothetical protein
MKKVFFCVMMEFYTDGRVLAGMKQSMCRAKPAAAFRALPGMHAYTDWYERRGDAERAVAEARSASAGREI